jgi:hypothetical protein
MFCSLMYRYPTYSKFFHKYHKLYCLILQFSAFWYSRTPRIKNCFKILPSTIRQKNINSQTCVQRPALVLKKSGRCSKVVVIQRLVLKNYYTKLGIMLAAVDRWSLFRVVNTGLTVNRNDPCLFYCYLIVNTPNGFCSYLFVVLGKF